MVEKNEVYKCSVCGNVVEVLTVGGGELVCCSKKMELLKENIVDAAEEKHVPVIEQISEKQVLVKVGSVPHPMTGEHYIEWIELMADGRVYRKNLESAMKPEARFQINPKTLSARAYCNLHGLWKSK